MTTILMIAALATVAFARQESLRAERTVPFKVMQVNALDVTVGPVRIANVRFSDLGRPPSLPFGLGPRATDLSTLVRAAFAAENPKAEDWSVKFTLEFLDRQGKVIDRAEKSGEFEGEAKTFQVDHDLLTYVMPSVDRVRISMEAKLD